MIRTRFSTQLATLTLARWVAPALAQPQAVGFARQSGGELPASLEATYRPALLNGDNE